MLPRTLDIPALFPAADPAAWRALVEADLQGAPFKKLVTRLYEGLDLQPLYSAGDPRGAASSGFTGLMPMTRAARPLGSVPGGWDIRQERAEADPAALNLALREDLAGGVTSVVVRFDACARAGLNPTDPRGAAVAASDGSAIYTLEDLDRALDGVHLHMIGVGLEAGAAFVPAAGLLAALWKRRGVGAADAVGWFQADPLAVLARDGQLPYSLERGLALAGELAAWTHRTFPRVAAVRVGTAAYHHAGATATQDLAFAMASGLEYLRALSAAGLSVDDAARQMHFSFAVGTGFFLAMAKLRAARRLWARVIEASGGGEEARRMTMFVRASKRVMTTRDPWVNILRGTVCVLAAGFAGADAVACTPFDASLGEPSPLARRLARNTHHLLMEEARAHRVADPAGGSWAIERLTDDLARAAWAILQEIERRGGMGACLRSGWVAEAIAREAEPRVRNLATRRDVVVGVSDFPNPGEARPRPAAVDRAAIVAAARARLAGRAGANGAAAAGAGDVSVAGQALALATVGASIGEIFARVRGADEDPATCTAVHVHPFAEPFERLRDASDRYAEECGHRPAAVLVACGPVAQHLARVNFCRNLFDAGGFAVSVIAGEAHGPELAAAIADQRARVAVICGPDASYAGLVPTLAPALHAAGAVRVVLAGNPGASEAAFRAAGVDEFVFVKCDVIRLLTDLHAAVGLPVEGSDATAARKASP